MSLVPVYFGHAVTFPDERKAAGVAFKARMDALKKDYFARLPNCRHVPFLGLNWKDPIEVYHADIPNGVGRSQLAVIIRDEQADGIIIETVLALERYGIPVIFARKAGIKVSGLLTGFLDHFAHLTVNVEYADAEDLVQITNQIIERHGLGLQLDLFQPGAEFAEPTASARAPVSA